MCVLCWGELTNYNKVALQCNHSFCKDCVRDYLEEKLKEGPIAIEATCPQFGCNLVMPHSLYDKLLTGDNLKTYLKYHCKAYTDDNKMVKWCP